ATDARGIYSSAPQNRGGRSTAQILYGAPGKGRQVPRGRRVTERPAPSRARPPARCPTPEARGIQLSENNHPRKGQAAGTTPDSHHGSCPAKERGRTSP